MTVKYRYDAVGLMRRVIAANRGYTNNTNDRLQFTLANDVSDPAGRFLHQNYTCSGWGNAGQTPLGNACGLASYLHAYHKYNRLAMLVFENDTSAANIELDSMRYDRSGNLTYERLNTDSLNFLMDTITGGKKTNLLALENFKFN